MSGGPEQIARQSDRVRPLVLDVVAGRFHDNPVASMLDAAADQARREDATIRHIIRVPGSMEKPLAVHRLLSAEAPPDAVVVLGIIERGETAHGHVMGIAVIQSLISLQLTHDRPVGIGILGPDIFPSQIASRLEPHARAAVAAAIAMCRTSPTR